MPGPANRPALTLIEFLVVIAIIGSLLGLLLSGIQKVRAVAARIQCANHLRQIGLAAQSYHDAHGAFPPGISGETTREPFLSWQARLLPYLGEEPLWKELNRAYGENEDFLRVPPHTRRGTVVPAFTCPADPRTLRPAMRVNVLVAFTAYLGVSGRDSEVLDGVLYLDSRTRITDVTNGTSNTLLAGERPPSADERFGWWYAGWGQRQDGSAEVVLGVADFNFVYSHCSPGPYRFGQGRIGNDCDTFHFWSLHPDGGHFLFTDGSVRFLSYSSHPLMPAWATRAGGKVSE